MPPTSPSCAVSRILQDRQGCVIQAREQPVMDEVSGMGLGWAVVGAPAAPQASTCRGAGALQAPEALPRDHLLFKGAGSLSQASFNPFPPSSLIRHPPALCCSQFPGLPANPCRQWD